MQNVMKKAWEIAKSGQVKFGGRAREYLAEASRMAWRVLLTMEKMKNIVKNASASEWKNYGKHRIYIEASISLIEQKEIRGNVVGALRRVSGKWYYDVVEGAMYRQSYIEKDMSTADDEVVDFMRSEIKKMIWGKVENA